MHDLIVIDDTGSPGAKEESRFLKSDRKTWVAVLIKKEIREDLTQIWNKTIKILKQQRGINELHFTDLINKKHEFEDFDNSEIIELLDVICEILYHYELPYFIQTTTPNTLKENDILIKGNIGKIDKFNIQKPEDLSLLLLFQRIKTYKDLSNISAQIEIVLDEGRKSATSSETFNFLKGYALNNEVKYQSSKDYSLLQIADFYAYSVNRMQRTLIKENVTDFDLDVLSLISEVLKFGLVSGGEIMENIDVRKFSKDDYDYHQRTKRQIDGNLEKWINANK